MRLIDRLKNEQRSLLSFRHGLGDIIQFFPIYKEICRITGKRIDLGVENKRQFQLLFPNVVSIDKMRDDVKSRYSFIHRVAYREPQGELSKPYECAINEFGLKDFVWEPYQFKTELNNENSKQIGINFFGITGSNKESKFCSLTTAYSIWEEIQQAGYNPFELYQRVGFITDYYREGLQVPDEFPLADNVNSLRFQKPDLGLIINEIKKSRKVISTDSGILYLAIMLLGKENVIGLENEKKISKYLPIEIIKVNIKSYKRGTIYNLLKY